MSLTLSIYPNATTRSVLLITVIKLLLYPRTYHGSQTSIKPHPNCPRFSFISHPHMFCSNHPFRTNLKPQKPFLMLFHQVQNVPIQLPLSLYEQVQHSLCSQVPFLGCLIHWAQTLEVKDYALPFLYISSVLSRVVNFVTCK